MDVLFILGVIVFFYVVFYLPMEKWAEHSLKKEKEEKAKKRGLEQNKLKNYNIYFDERNYPVLLTPTEELNRRHFREAFDFEEQPLEGKYEQELFNVMKEYFDEKKISHGKYQLHPFGEHPRFNHGRAESYTYDPYYPDLVYYDPDNNIAIDIEVDEPYVLRDGSKKPIHYIIENQLDDRITSIDWKRDRRFNKNGWYVVRFSEGQVKTQTHSCCKYLARVICYYSDLDFEIDFSHTFSSVENIKPQRRWTEEAVKTFMRS